MKNSARESSGRRILVVDDEPAVCEALKEMLEFDGHAVQTTGSGKEALSLFERGSFDVVITDYAISDMRGDKLAAAIKQRRPDQPVVMITAHADVLKASRNPLTGVDFLLNKPFLMSDLREAIFRVLPATKMSNAEEFKSAHQPGAGGAL
jgi:CheY-like chemotaxis protein